MLFDQKKLRRTGSKSRNSHQNLEDQPNQVQVLRFHLKFKINPAICTKKVINHIEKASNHQAKFKIG